MFIDYNPCSCAIADCFIDCVLDKSGLTKLHGLDKQCREALSMSIKEGNCPFWSHDNQTKEGNGGVPGANVIENKECIDKVNEVVKKLKEIMKTRNYTEFLSPYSACVNCCMLNFLQCMSHGVQGQFILEGNPYPDSYWGFGIDTGGEYGCILPTG